MSDPVTRALTERQALERGFSGSLAVSLAGHALLLVGALVVPLLLPVAPPFQVADGFVVPLPRGGGGTPQASDPAPAPQVPQARPSEPAPDPQPARVEPPPKIIKPPKIEEPRRGLPPAEKPRRTRREPSPPPQRATSTQTAGSSTSRGSTPNATGTSSTTPGLDFLPQGPGVPDGVDLNGDWYLAGVQRKIWLIWARQMQTGLTQPIRVTFTILADGSVEDVRVLEPSLVPMLNLAAQRAVVSAAPFGPLPRNYGTARFTLQALFKSTS